METPIISSSKEIQSNAIGKETYGNFSEHEGVLPVYFHDHDNNVTPENVTVAYLRGYGRLFVAKHLGCSAKASSLCNIMEGPILSTRLVIGYGAIAGRLCNTLCTFLMLHPVFSISLDPLKRPAWQVICNKHQCEASCHLLAIHITPISFMQGYKP
jgi:hypothetical protein